MAKMRAGDTPIDWYIHKLGATDYRLNQQGTKIPKLKFKSKYKSRKKSGLRYDYILVKSETLGNVQLNTKVAPSVIKSKYPSMEVAIYFKDKRVVKVVK